MDTKAGIQKKAVAIAETPSKFDRYDQNSENGRSSLANSAFNRILSNALRGFCFQEIYDNDTGSK